MRPTTLAALTAARVIPVIDLPNPDHAEALAEALLGAGARVAEMTLRSPQAIESLAAMVGAAERLGRGPSGHSLLVGAGTVLTLDQLAATVDTGSQFAVSPGYSVGLASAAADSGVDWVPGAATASEVMSVLDSGRTLAKFFPAESSGGVAALKGLLGPFSSSGLQFMPTGGITPGNAPDYLGLDGVIAVGGSWMVKPALLDGSHWHEVQALMTAAVAL